MKCEFIDTRDARPYDHGNSMAHPSRWSSRRISDPMILEQAYKFITADYLMKPYPSIKGIAITWQDRNKPGIAELNPLRFADMDLLKELEASRFRGRAYGKKL
jgi:hypothetical protein